MIRKLIAAGLIWGLMAALPLRSALAGFHVPPPPRISEDTVDDWWEKNKKKFPLDEYEPKPDAVVSGEGVKKSDGQPEEQGASAKQEPAEDFTDQLKTFKVESQIEVFHFCHSMITELEKRGKDAAFREKQAYDQVIELINKQFPFLGHSPVNYQRFEENFMEKVMDRLDPANMSPVKVIWNDLQTACKVAVLQGRSNWARRQLEIAARVADEKWNQWPTPNQDQMVNMVQLLGVLKFWNSENKDFFTMDGKEKWGDNKEKLVAKCLSWLKDTGPYAVQTIELALDEYISEYRTRISLVTPQSLFIRYEFVNPMDPHRVLVNSDFEESLKRISTEIRGEWRRRKQG